MFQDKTVLEIIEEVFAADGAHANWWISPEVEGFLSQVRPRSYCRQYRESDYDFVSRLPAEEGINLSGVNRQMTPSLLQSGPSLAPRL